MTQDSQDQNIHQSAQGGTQTTLAHEPIWFTQKKATNALP